MTEPAPVPERLRLRVVALVSAVLPSVTPVPLPLRKVAGFAPARRARLGGGAIWAALEDDAFREHAAVQVAAVPGQDDDPLDRAARAWLSREDGWEGVVAEVVESLAADPQHDDQVSAEHSRLTAQVAALQAELVAARALHREELDRAKADHKVLRQRLGEARGVLRAAESERDAAYAARDEALAEADRATRAAEADVRRLRAQLDEAESGLAATRRDARSERDAASIRARLLLDAVVDAATGLRRELALPPLSGAPGDAVEAALAGIEAAPTSSAPATPALLEQTLAMPRSRLIVDGYNVTKQAWPTASLEAQRSRLVSALGPLVARSGAETTVVFDAAESTVRTAMPAPRGVRVVFSPEGVIADDVIRQLVAAEPRGRVVVVVSDDQAVARDVTGSGARSVPASALLGAIGA
ncbi:RNA-binding protein [Nocardioides flavus (ex Wang et al. 2016)]|uniref:RNA-binding protein n=1 Tax=Nocardioides flavus (ex Wang et al. 2016) TaxID=2058780 RepID=A0ABQ3HI02_9ACTN|nr:NYN domain-containing protein [Nocardioides flavus (ex Wang et al. 2016)]GHE17285.1 RNA-binding protein [Nocardioides flavus (ex Wang et al. 2016)]